MGVGVGVAAGVGVGVGVGVATGVGVGVGVGLGVVPAAQVMAASKRAVPLAVKLAGVASPMNNPTRRAGALRPGMTAPIS